MECIVVSISCSMKLTMFSIRFLIKIEVSIDITPYGKLMEAYGCFYKLKCIYYKANHVFHKLSTTFAPKIELLINTTDIWKAYGSVWLLP